MADPDAADLDLVPERGDTILITDASAEGEAIASALKARDFHVIDVPLSLLEARVIGESPRVLLVDVDQPGAVEAVERVRELSIGRSELLCIGDRARAAELGVEHATGKTFQRPVDVELLVSTVSTFAKPARRDARIRGTTPPPSYAPRRETSPPMGRDPDMMVVSEFPPPVSDPLDVESFLPSLEENALAGRISVTQLSPELERLLSAAEERVLAGDNPESSPEGDEDEVDLLLPPELLAALDEPLDPDVEGVGTGSGVGAETPLPKIQTTTSGKFVTGANPGTGASTNADVLTGATSAGTQAPRTNVDEIEEVLEKTGPSADRAPTPLPGPVESSLGRGGPPTRWEEGPPTQFETNRPLPARGRTEVEPIASGSPQPPPVATPLPAAVKPATSGASRVTLPRQRESPPSVPFPAVLGEGDALRSLARAIATRASGSLALGTPSALRRIVLRDGDIVTAGSGLVDETLLAFLVARGDIERDAALQLSGKLPPFGRHAGAALIAHGYLGQDDLWPVLRAHAEWVIARAAAVDEGSCELEQEPPGRLKAEPNVFGGATGAEVLVETVRRVFSPELALARLGGRRARIESGPRVSLLAECALSREEDDVVRSGFGHTLGEILEGAGEELANVLYALAALDVLEVIVPVKSARDKAAAEADPLDEEALRQRIRARMALAQEGDYFALLGLPRTATGYEIKRAYLELRRTFEPGRVLTPQIADLADDVRLVVEVIEEAYEILRDSHRRERYRRAIEAGPPS